MASKTFENVSFRKGFDKGQNTMGMRWFPKTKLTIEKGKMLYSTPTVSIMVNDGLGFRERFGNIVYWKDNQCIRSKKKIMWGMPAAKPNRIDLGSRFGNTVASLSVPDEKTYNDIKQTLTSLIGAAKCGEIAETRAEQQRKQHLVKGGKRHKRRRKTRKDKKRKTKRKRKKTRKKTRKKKGGRTECVNDAQCKAAKDLDFSDFGRTRLTGKCTMASGECELGELEISSGEAAMALDLTPPALVRSPAFRRPRLHLGGKKKLSVRRGGAKADLNACIKKCNDAEEERKKQKRMEREARKKEWMKETYAMGFPGAIAAHEKRKQDRFAPETWKTRQAELMRGLSGGKRRKTKKKRRRR